MTKKTKIEDGVYFLHPEGSCWKAVEYRDGKYVDAAEESDHGTHMAANDGWAGVVPSDDDDEADEVTAETIVRDVYEDLDGNCRVNPSMVSVSRRTQAQGE